MKALFAGLGSIGTRHLQNLVELCAQRELPLEVSAWRSSEKPLPENAAPLVDREFADLPAQESYDLAFITGPTHRHAATIEQLKGRVGAFFIEKPVFDSTGYDLDKLGLGSGQKAYVAAPLRWTALYPVLRRAAMENRVYSARAICSSYLPDWRPNVDYRTVYSAHSAMGGGVMLDLIHEWDYLYDLFGPPENCFGFVGKVSELEIDSDDLAVYIARYPNLLCEVHLDYFGRTYRRTLELFAPQGTFVADFGAGTLAKPDGTTEDYSEPANKKYEREMAYFLDYALEEGAEESLSSPARALDVLKIAVGE